METFVLLKENFKKILFFNIKMRLWSINPFYLDTKGLLALWREGLLAKKVLERKTKGYKNHPQLLRFKRYQDPLLAINSFLYFVIIEAEKRGYNFDRNKISIEKPETSIIPVTKGQVYFELKHLTEKLKVRDTKQYKKVMDNSKEILTNPIFYIIDGDIEEWEKVK